MDVTTRLIIGFAALTPFVASASDVCEDTPPAFSIFEDLSDVLPPPRTDLLNEPHHRVSLCTDVPLVRLDETNRRADITVRVPLEKLALAPMTPETFAKAIKDVDVPAPWSLDGTVAWRLDGQTLVIDVKNGSVEAASAWAQLQGFVRIRTAAGQNVVIEVFAPTLTVDETAFHMKNLREREKYIEQMLVFNAERLAAARARIANPETITTGNEPFLAEMEAQLAANKATAAAMQPELRAAWAAGGISEQIVAYGRLEREVTGADLETLVATRGRLIPASNAKVRADEHVKSERAVLEGFERVAAERPSPNWAAHVEEWRGRVADAEAKAAAAATTLTAVQRELAAFASSRGLEDTLLETIDELETNDYSRYGAAVRGVVRVTKTIAETKATIARERAARVESDKVGANQVQTELAALAADQKVVKAKLAAGEKTLRTMPTKHEVSCPAS